MYLCTTFLNPSYNSSVDIAAKHKNKCIAQLRSSHDSHTGVTDDKQLKITKVRRRSIG